MNRALFRSRYISRGAAYTISACLFTTGFFRWPPAKLYNDSDSNEQWPKTRPLITSAGNRFSDDTQSSNRSSQNDHQTDPESIDSNDEDIALFEDEDSAAWASFSTRFSMARDHLTSIHWPTLRDKIVDRAFPEWALAIPGYIAKLQAELEMGPSSLAYEIWVCPLKVLYHE